MGKCSYRWKEWNSKKGKSIEKRCPKETWKDSNEYCIFHDPSKEKNVDLFNEKFKKQMQIDTEEHYFVGYHFPEGGCDFKDHKFKIDVSFKNATFEDITSFREGTFQGKANFRRVSFLKEVSFRDVTFQSRANFGKAAFQSTANFRGSDFENANFKRAIFQDGNFRRITFHRDVNFRKTEFQNAYFRGSIFQSTTNFRGANFKNANFKEVTFQSADFRGTIFKVVNFVEATFHRDTNFRGTTFLKNANFRKTVFDKSVDFGEATFKNAYFKEAVFQNANFRRTGFEKKLVFTPKRIRKLNFKYTEFLFRSKISADLTKTMFHGAFMDDVAFLGCKWPENKILYEEKHMHDEKIDLSFEKLETIYRALKQNMQRHGDYSKAGKFYYREMEMKRKGSKGKKRIWFELYHLLAGYGECPQNTATVSGSIIFLFALFYWGLKCLQYSSRDPTLFQQMKDAVYFSFVTFTTLGLGDIHPINDWGKVLICCEAIIGAFLIALFVVVFVRKMAR